MVVTDLTVSEKIVHKGVTYDVGGNPHTVSDQIAAYLKFIFPGAVTATVPGGNKNILMSSTRIRSGSRRNSGSSYNGVDNLTALAYIEMGHASEVAASSLTQSVEMVQINGAGLEWITQPVVTTYPWARGCWVFLPVATTPSLHQREFFQALNAGGHGAFLQTRRATSGDPKIQILSERTATGSGTAYQPFFDELDLRGRWVHIHEEHIAANDVRIYVENVEDSYGSEASRNQFATGSLITHIFGGKVAAELPAIGYYSCPYIYVDRVPAAAVRAELQLYTPQTVSDPPDECNLLNGDLASAVGGSAMQERAVGSFTYVESAPAITDKSTLNGTHIITSTAVGAQTDLPIEFGFEIPQGLLASTERLVVKDGATPLAIGEDNRSSDEADDVRFVKVTGILPSLAAGQVKSLTITKETGTPVAGTPITLADIQATDFEAAAKITIGGTLYTALASEALASVAAWGVGNKVNHGKWRENGHCTEFICSAPLETVVPVAHSHARAWFHITAYKKEVGAVSGPNPVTAIRCDITIENGYQFVAAPGDLTYDYAIDLTDSGVTTPVSRAGFVHPYAQRYKDRVWWGTEPEYFALPDWDYLKSTGMIANFAFDVGDFAALDTTVIDNDAEPFSSVNNASYSRGVVHNMGTTGGRPEIGLFHEDGLEGIAQGDLAGYRNLIEKAETGSWFPHHWRDEADGGFIKPDAQGAVKNNWTSLRSGQGVEVTWPGSTVSPWTLDTAHWPCLPYLAYMVTGDFGFFEELAFDAQYVWGEGTFWDAEYTNSALTNGWRRSWQNGSQERAQAWQARNPGFASALYPDALPAGLQAFGTQDKLRAWVEDGYKRLKESHVDSTSIDGTIEAGKRWVATDGIRFFKGSGNTTNEYGESDSRWNSWQTNYHNLTLAQMGDSEMNILRTNGQLCRDWILQGIVEVANYSGGAMVDYLFSNYKSLDWSGTRGDGILHDPRITNIFRNQARAISTEVSDSWYKTNVGTITLSAVSGGAVTLTSTADEFFGTLSHYAGLYIVEGVSVSTGRAQIVGTPTDGKTAVIDTTYLSKEAGATDAKYIGNPFTKTVFAPGELRLARPDDQYGVKGSNAMGANDNTQFTLARGAAASAKTIGLTGADTAWTYASALSDTRFGVGVVSKPQFHIDPRV